MSKILKEFRASNMPSLENLTQVFGKLGKLSRIGGPERVFDVASEGKKAVAFCIGMGSNAIAFGWSASPSHVETIYFWEEYAFNREPDYAIDLPEGDVAAMAPAIFKMLKDHTIGSVEI